MRRHIYFLTTLISIMMVACSTCEEEFVPASPKDGGIAFLPSVAQTRAGETTTASINNEGNIFSVNTFVESGDGLSPFFSTTVAYNNSEWSSAKKYYWPTYADLTFYAYTPMSENIVLNEDKDILTYKCPAEINSQVDLLTRTLSGRNADNSSPVEMDFDHALSSIKFKLNFKDEKHITLNHIKVNYIGIENEREYSFSAERGDESGDLGEWLVPASKSYFDADSGVDTHIFLSDEDRTQSTNNPTIDPIIFDVDNRLMILPQELDFSKGSPHHLSVQVSYSLNDALNNPITNIVTSTVPLPSPTVESVVEDRYRMGYLYTYTLLINGDQILTASAGIADSEVPKPAFGNIDLGLITRQLNYAEYRDEVDNFYPNIESSVTSDGGSHYFYDAAVRAANLLNRGVRDFVVVGRYNAEDVDVDDDGKSEGKLGYYGSTSSPFFIAAKSLGMIPDFHIETTEDGNEIMRFDAPDPNHLFSVDLRGVYKFPLFGHGTTTEGDMLPDNAHIIPNGLFKDIPLLDEVIFPRDVAAIGTHAFQNCRSLTTVDLAQVVHIEAGGFDSCIGLVEVKNGQLTRVHRNGFDGCKSLTTIDLSKVENMGDYAFVNCEKLTNVDLSMLHNVGNYAFSGCSDLTLVTQPSFVYVGNYAFSGCRNMGVHKVPVDLTEVTFVGVEAFNDCNHVKLSDGHLDDLVTICANAFSNCTEIGTNFLVRLPSIESIGQTAFAYCENVNVVEGLDRLDKISKNTFMGATKFTGYDNSDGSTADQWLKLDVDSVGVSAFKSTAVTDVRFANVNHQTTRIYDHAFESCDKLVSVSGLDFVTHTGKNAFALCTSLESLSLPLLTSDNCGDGLIANATSLKSISLPSLEVNKSWNDEYARATITTLSMVAGAPVVESIDLRSLETEITGGFSYKVDLKYANFDAVTKLGNNAFQGCSALEEIRLAGVTSVGVLAFQECTSLEELILPEVTEFGSDFINVCTSLKKLQMDKLVNNTATIEGGWGGTISEIVKKNSSIETLILPDVTGSFGGWEAFTNSLLKYVDLSSVAELLGGSFVNNNTLVSIDLSSLTTLGGLAFQNCVALEKINVSSLENYTDSGNWSFSGIPAGQCEVWISAAQEANVTGEVWWQGVQWKKIHIKKTDGSFDEPFTLE